MFKPFYAYREGTPLNKAEKISAHRGLFKDTFKNTRETHKFFTLLGKDKRFRWRQLAAEMLLIELEGDFQRRVFPDLELHTLVKGVKSYQKKIPAKKVKAFIGNLDVLHSSLNLMLTAFSPRESIAFYLLVSWLRKQRADNSQLLNELFEFGKEFLRNLNSFSLYEVDPPPGMTKKLFSRYKQFKQESKILTTFESLTNRLGIMIEEFKRLHPIIVRDPDRLHDAEQKRLLFFRQNGLCGECGKQMRFGDSSSHHIIPHAKGGKTDDLTHAILLHDRCHKRLEKRLKKEQWKKRGKPTNA